MSQWERPTDAIALSSAKSLGSYHQLHSSHPTPLPLTHVSPSRCRVTNLLAPHALPAPRDPKHRKKQRRAAMADGDQAEGDAAAGGEAAAGIGPGSAADAAAAASAAAAGEFIPATKWQGRKPGFAFKLGRLGLGYYPDHGLSGTKAAGATAAAAAAAAAAAGGGEAAGEAAAAAAAAAGQQAAGWVPMKNVADLRRALGIGAPRNSGGGVVDVGGRYSAPGSLCSINWVNARIQEVLAQGWVLPCSSPTDSLYRPIERAPRKFNPLKIPKSLQVGGFAAPCCAVLYWRAMLFE